MFSHPRPEDGPTYGDLAVTREAKQTLRSLHKAALKAFTGGAQLGALTDPSGTLDPDITAGMRDLQQLGADLLETAALLDSMFEK